MDLWPSMTGLTGDECPGGGVNESQSIEKPHFSQKREKWGTLWFVIEKRATRHPLVCN
jgi:hypothetical protein